MTLLKLQVHAAVLHFSVLFLVSFLEKMKREGFVTGEREWTDISFLIELCRLNYYIVIVITIIIITSFDTGCSV